MKAHPRSLKCLEANLDLSRKLVRLEEKFEDARFYSTKLLAYGKISLLLAQFIDHIPPGKSTPIEGTLDQASPYETALLRALREVQQEHQLTLAELLSFISNLQNQEAEHLLNSERERKKTKG